MSTTLRLDPYLRVRISDAPIDPLEARRHKEAHGLEDAYADPYYVRLGSLRRELSRVDEDLMRPCLVVEDSGRWVCDLKKRPGDLAPELTAREIVSLRDDGSDLGPLLSAYRIYSLRCDAADATAKAYEACRDRRIDVFVGEHGSELLQRLKREGHPHQKTVENEVHAHLLEYLGSWPIATLTADGRRTAAWGAREATLPDLDLLSEVRTALGARGEGWKCEFVGVHPDGLGVLASLDGWYPFPVRLIASVAPAKGGDS